MNYKLVLNNISKYGFNIDELYKIEDIYNIFDDFYSSKKEILEILEQKYLNDKVNLSEQELLSLTNSYHKSINECNDFFKELEIANKIRNLDFETLEKFLEDKESIKKIERCPKWYMDENGDVAILSRIILEEKYRDRVHDRSIEMEWEELSRGISNIFDKMGTKKDIQRIYDSLNIDSKIKDVSIRDYKYNVENIINDLEKGKYDLDDVLTLLGKDLKINGAFNGIHKSSIIELLTYEEGKEILDFIERNGTETQFKEFKAYYDYILNDDITENLSCYAKSNLLSNLLIAERNYYNETHESLFLNEKDIVDISSILENATRISSKEYEGDIKYCGYCKVDGKAKNFMGVYFDEINDNFKILVSNFDDDSKMQTYEVDKEDFLKSLDGLCEREFKREDIFEKVLNSSSSLDKRFILEDFKIESLEEKETIELE